MTRQDYAAERQRLMIEMMATQIALDAEPTPELLRSMDRLESSLSELNRNADRPSEELLVLA